MKRIKAAYVEQIIHFQLNEHVPHETAVQTIQEEYERYKKHLNYKKTPYKLLDETILPDGSIQIRIRKQHNSFPIGDFLD